MDLKWTAQDLEFRDEVRAFLADNLTDDLRQVGQSLTSVYVDYAVSAEWQRRMNDHGWGAPGWAVEDGGCGWSPLQRYIFDRERIEAGAPPIPFGVGMCGPALIGFGTEEQKNFYLPRMLSGEHYWCQGYSEPDSGSDLASLQMAAVDDGDALVCSGSKIWTTHAHEANWMFCLVRTSQEAKPQLGITFLLIEMDQPGIRVDPIVSLTGEHIQNQVFFDEVRVPKANVVGEIGRGWTVAKFLLEYERGGSAYAPRFRVQIERIRHTAAEALGPRGGSLVEDPLFAAKLAAAEIRIAALEIYEWRAMSTPGSPGLASSVMKILGTELSQHLTELALEASGPYAMAYQPQAGSPGGAVRLPYAEGDEIVGSKAAALAPLRYLNDRAGTIYAGSNEIQRNILAKASLGL